ncbi:unnamed protein product [Schistocephalus solidus]|uniref:Secreted protein n=1 Tax=Schistocephalus solidus TaxID=70667 RepID=A0A183T3G8_SCHSO|nr:unnamed protein product [Schistocephalus solidus]
MDPLPPLPTLTSLALLAIMTQSTYCPGRTGAAIVGRGRRGLNPKPRLITTMPPSLPHGWRQYWAQAASVLPGWRVPWNSLNPFLGPRSYG